jgi:hypothetical protein
MQNHHLYLLALQPTAARPQPHDQFWCKARTKALLLPTLSAVFRMSEDAALPSFIFHKIIFPMWKSRAIGQQRWFYVIESGRIVVAARNAGTPVLWKVTYRGKLFGIESP